jgi:hypothetical protein
MRNAGQAQLQACRQKTACKSIFAANDRVKPRPGSFALKWRRKMCREKRCRRISAPVSQVDIKEENE